MLLLNPPHKPRFDVTATISTLLLSFILANLFSDGSVTALKF